uniref:Uncharacterized protein n=1 Tax=Neobodo designis TaxID=312471 RepID=A0A7S1Q8R9_NEODS
MAAPSEANPWAPVAEWHETSSNTERDKRKKVLAPLLEHALQAPHRLGIHDCTVIVTAARSIVDIVEPPQRATAGCLLALALRRTSALIGPRSIYAMADALLTIALDAGSKSRMYRRALAMAVIAHALQLHPRVGSNPTFGDPGNGQKCRFVTALPALLQELGAKRQWAKRTTLQTKGDQEQLFDDVATFRCAIATVVEVLAAAGVIGGADVLLPLLDEPGYKARDLATRRAALAALASCAAAHRWAKKSRGVSDRSAAMLLSRDVDHIAPDKTAQKQRFVKAMPTPVVWTWDDRCVRHVVALAARAAAGPAAQTDHHGVVLRLTQGGTTEGALDGAAAAANAAHLQVLGPAVAARLVQAVVSSALTASVPVALAALGSTRVVFQALTRAVLRDRNAMGDFTANVNELTAPLYGALQHLYRHLPTSDRVLAAAGAAWVDAMILRHASRSLDASDASDALREITEALAGRNGCAAVAQSALASLGAVAAIAPTPAAADTLVSPFRAPLTSLFADAVMATVGRPLTGDPIQPHVNPSALARSFFAVVDGTGLAAAAASSSAMTEASPPCYTVLALDAVASELDPLDTRLTAVTSDRAVIAGLWAQRNGAEHAAGGSGGPTTMRLHQALLLAPSESSRVALSCVLNTLAKTSS